MHGLGWGFGPFYATEIKFTQNWIRLNKHESQDASWRQLPRRQVQVQRNTQKSQIKIALKDEDVENGGGTAEAAAGAGAVEGGAVLEVIEKHREIHKARNAQRALRVTEFNGNGNGSGSGCVCGAERRMRRQQKGTSKKHAQSRVPSTQSRVPRKEHSKLPKKITNNIPGITKGTRQKLQERWMETEKETRRETRHVRRNLANWRTLKYTLFGNESTQFAEISVRAYLIYDYYAGASGALQIVFLCTFQLRVFKLELSMCSDSRANNK